MLHARAPSRPLTATPQPFPPPEALGQHFPPYQPTFESAGDFIDEEHRAIATLPTEGGLIRVETPGFLRPDDALSLYELAYRADGDVLELGSAWGLSTTFLCRAVLNAGRGGRVVSIEINPDFQRATAATLRDAGLQRCHRSIPGDANEAIDRLVARGRTYGFIFVDFDHTYGATQRLCNGLHRVLRPGGMVLFHDFNDRRNISEPEEYGVYRAVAEMLDEGRMVFLGTIGCCGLIHRPATG